MSEHSSILGHYSIGHESGRLEQGAGQLERIRTEELLGRFLPPPPADVLDVGGGPGVYAEWLAAKGYAVELVDIVPLHVEQASARFRAHSANARAHLGDARSLAFGDETQDAVLLMGPLYHLQERADRMTALHEARRVLRPGGRIAAVVISRFASLLDGTSRGLVRDPAFVRILERDLASGRHVSDSDVPDYFTTAFLHHPDEVLGEMEDAGLAAVTLTAIEGPFWCLGSFDELWSDAATRALMLSSLAKIDRDPTLIGASAHILVTGVKPV